MRHDSYRKIGGELLAVLAAMVAVAAFGLPRPLPKKPTPAPPTVSQPEKVVPPSPPDAPISAPPPGPILDGEAVAMAEERAEAARGDRDRAEARASMAERSLKAAQAHASAALMAYRGLASTVRDARPRIGAALARGEALKADRDRLQGELMALNEATRPRRKPLIDKSPVARQAEGDEYHFEIRGDRVAYIDLERLLDRVKSDARMQIRMGSGDRPIGGSAGPVGWFSIKYEVGRLDDGSNPRIGNFGLQGWEIVPEQEVRGETFDQAMGASSSEFSRAIHRLNPERDVVTLWVYPDGFALYRQLRDTLHANGFLVAARPLPAEMPIRGSPSGSSSSAQ